MNTEAALVCLTSMVEDLVQNKTGPMDVTKWLGEISPAVIKLKSFVEIVCQKANYFMSFFDLMVSYCFRVACSKQANQWGSLFCCLSIHLSVCHALMSWPV